MEPKDIFYLVGIVLGFALGCWNLVTNWRTSRRTIFINTITSQRIKWIEQLRQDIAGLSGLIYNWAFSQLQGESDEKEVIKEIDRLRYLVRLRLNPEGQYDKKIEHTIAEIPNLTDISKRPQLKDALNGLIITTQLLLKEEWEKVKQESEFGNLKKHGVR